jgi:hypothetical protein
VLNAPKLVLVADIISENYKHTFVNNNGIMEVNLTPETLSTLV